MLKDQTLCQFLNVKLDQHKPFIITHNGNEVYYEDFEGYWSKSKYDSDGNETYYENSNGFWYKQKHDSEGNQIYYEDSTGFIYDIRPKEISMDEIAEKFGIPVSQLKIKK